METIQNGDGSRLSRWTLAGKRALVTGGTKGIGLGIAEELLLLGATVTVVARTADRLDATVKDWTERGLPTFGVCADIVDSAGRASAVASAADAMNGIDILINNVGTNVRSSSIDYASSDYNRVFETNVTAAWEMCRTAYPYLKGEGDASIVNIGSVSGSVFVGSGAPYAMTKAALDQMTHYLAVEWAVDGIRVNAVNPWYTKTPLAAPVLDDPERLAGVLARTPLGRVAEAEDVAGITAFLCLPAAAYITGQCISVDGGFLSFGFKPTR